MYFDRNFQHKLLSSSRSTMTKQVEKKRDKEKQELNSILTMDLTNLVSQITHRKSH